MNHLNAFKANRQLIEKYGIGNAHIVWVMGLYLDSPNLNELASECLTDNTDDKKIDFIKLDIDNKKLVFAQGYYSERKVDSAPANKASDLNTAAAWLLSGNADEIPSPLKEIIINCREALANGDVEQIDLLYVHNLSESVSVAKELKTVGEHLSNSLPKDKHIVVISKELGLKETEDLFTEQSSQIVITEEIECPAQLQFEETGPDWSSGVMSIPATWLREQFLKHGDKLFSANYRGFLGISRRKKINFGIKLTAEKQPQNFWAYNNGVTILTINYKQKTKTTSLTGISIINGAQTTGSIGSLESSIDLSNVRVLARVIKCSNPATIEDIIKYNNTQNRITTWDKFSNDSTQKSIQDEFKKFGHTYSLKRGFAENIGEVGIENVAQSLISLLGYYSDANRGKNGVFESDALYKLAFEAVKARHILFAYCLSRAIDERRYELKGKKDLNTIIALEEKQLKLLRNLRFKYFFIGVIGLCLESLLGQKLDIRQVGFTANACKAENNTINDLIVNILPIISTILTFTTTIIDGKDFSEILEKENSLDTIGNQVSALIYATLTSVSNPMIDQFRGIMTIN